jgi:SAM-dependent methyltransferase
MSADERPPQAIVMQMMMGAWTAQTVAAVTRLDVPDLLHKHGPLTAQQLTADHGVAAEPTFLHRALRACASVGVFSEDADGRFGPTPLSEPLTTASATSVRRFVELIGGRWWGLFGALPDALRAGRRPATAAGEEDLWRSDPAHRRRFAEAMKSHVDSVRGVLAHTDFSDTRSVVDVGGSLGHLSIALLERYPHLRATVLDLPEVIELAEEHAASVDAGVRQRLSFVAGDMFDDVPPGDTCVLKAIVHDWDDARAIRVLEHCRRRVPPDGRVLCVDNVLPPLGDTGCSGTKLLDMLMMVSLPGRERTEQEWRALYDAAGLTVRAITLVNARNGQSIIDGVPRR